MERQTLPNERMASIVRRRVPAAAQDRRYAATGGLLIGRFCVLALEQALAADWRAIRGRIELEFARLACAPGLAPTKIMQCLLVSGEDHRHGRHPGFDPIAIGRAMWRRFSRGSHEGASTIEQQIVRVVTGRYERSLARKLREILLAIIVANRYPKDVLPAVYLAIGYYGWRMNGFDQACRRLGLTPQSASLHDSARLVARLKYPQPRKASALRVSQISRRAKHLCALYERHSSDGTYGYLNGETVRNRSSALKPVPQS